MRDRTRTVVFAVVLGLVCSLALAGVNQFTAPFRKANEKAEAIKNLLVALEVPVDLKASPGTLLEIFNKNIREKKLGGYTIYEYVPDSSMEKPQAVAVYIAGAGLWAPVEGVIALEPDLETIRGVRFYKQAETPGLGGEIGSASFQKKFVGKKLVSEEGNPGFEIVKPGVLTHQNSIDGITSATMTSDRVAIILNTFAKELAKERESYVR